MWCLCFAILAFPAWVGAWSCGNWNGTSPFAPRELQLLAERTSLPAQVIMLMRAKMYNLHPSDFTVQEDGLLIEPGQRLLNDDGVTTAVHILVRRSTQLNGTMASWRRPLEDWLRMQWPKAYVRLSVFAGDPVLRAWTNWTLGAAVRIPDHWPTARFDAGSNAFEALLQGLDILEESTRNWPYFHVHRVLVVWSDDSDRSFRVPLARVQNRLQQNRAIVVVADVGHRWTQLSSAFADIVTLTDDTLPSFLPFWQHVASQVALWTENVYLLGFCTTSREGTHVVQVNEDNVRFSYDAHAFGGDLPCALLDAARHAEYVLQPWPDCRSLPTDVLQFEGRTRTWIAVFAAAIGIAYLIALGVYVGFRVRCCGHDYSSVAT